MDTNLVMTLISLFGTAIGTFGGIMTANKLTNYRIEQLEKQVEKHNSVVERTYKLEKNVALVFEKIDEEDKKIDLIRQDIDKLKDSK